MIPTGNLAIESVAGGRPGQRVLRLNGRLAMETAPEFLKSVRGVTEPVLILDFSGVPYIDSAGVGSLVQTLASFRKSQRQLALAGINDRVTSVLQVTKVHGLLPNFPTVSEAQEKLG